MCKTCMDCVYYYEDTDFCLNHMYNVIGNVEICADKRNKGDYSPDTFISHEDLDFSIELTDCRPAHTTIKELFNELKAINEEALNY